MNEKWCYLFEKFSEGALNDEEQRLLCKIHGENEDFKKFWLEASGQLSLVSTLKPVDELKSFLSASLFLDKKINKKKRSVLPFFLKVAAVILITGMPVYIYLAKEKLPEITYSSTPVSSYDFLFFRSVKLQNEVAVFKFKEGSVSVKGPAVLRQTFNGSLEVDSGVLHVSSNEGENLKIKTPHRSYVDIGTKFGLSISPAQSELHVFDGTVEVSGDTLVKKGKALLSRKAINEAIPIKRNIFLSEVQIQELLVSKKKFDLQKERLLKSSDVYEYFDFTNILSVSETFSGLKGTSMKLIGKVHGVSEGPYWGATALAFSEGEEFLTFEIPEGISDDYAIYISFYYEDYHARPSMIMKDTSANLNLSQQMSWFKTEYGKNGFLSEGFWKYRGLFLAKNTTKQAFSNMNDILKWKNLPENFTNDFMIGHSLQNGLNFKGRVASVIIFKSSKIKEVQKLFDHNN